MATAKHMKIPAIIDDSNVKDLYVYNSNYATEETSSGYSTLLSTDSNGDTWLRLNGTNTFAFVTNSDWLPNICTVSMKVKFDAEAFSSEFGLFGYGADADVLTHDFWGLVVKNDTEGIKRFTLLSSNGSSDWEVEFDTFAFNSVQFNANTEYNITFTQTGSTAKIYIDGVLKDTKTLANPLTSSSYPSRIYFGSMGTITSYDTIKGYIKEVAMWKRIIPLSDIYDLYTYGDLLENPGINDSSKKIQINGGKFYSDGFIHEINDKTLYITGASETTETVYIVVTESIVTESDDSSLLDNATGHYNLGKPGCHRIKYTYDIVVDPDLSQYKYSIKLLTFYEGELTWSLIAENDADTTEFSTGDYTLDRLNYSLSQKIYDAIYAIAGNFIVDGLDINMLTDGTNYTISVNDGTYYLLGKKYNVDKTEFTIPNATSTNEISEESHYVTVLPIELDFQPVDSITSVVAPINASTSIFHGATDGEDIVDADMISITLVNDGETDYVEGEENDYVMGVGTIDWSPAGNEPDPAVGETPGEEYTINYVKNATLVADTDYELIYGNRVADEETATFTAVGDIHSLSFNPTYIRSMTFGESGTVSRDNIELVDNGFKILSAVDGLTAGTDLTINYCYNSNQSIEPKWNIVIFTDVSDVVVGGTFYITYDYNQHEIYTLAVDTDNTIKLYDGVHGTKETVSKPSIDKNALPLADIYINPSSSDKSRLEKYKIYSKSFADINRLEERIEKVEDEFKLNSLEQKAEDLSSTATLIFTDSLGNYERSDSTMVGNIDIINEKLQSEYDPDYSILNPNNISTIHEFDGIGFATNFSDSTASLDQDEYSEFINMNYSGSAEVNPEIFVLDSYKYINSTLSTKISHLVHCGINNDFGPIISKLFVSNSLLTSESLYPDKYEIANYSGFKIYIHIMIKIE